MWRLHAHVPKLSALYDVYANVLRASDVDHTECEDWVIDFNAIFARIARAYGDLVLDWFAFSHFYARHFMSQQPVPVAVKYDFIHYFAGGFPMSAAILVQETIRDSISSVLGPSPFLWNALFFLGWH